MGRLETNGYYALGVPFYLAIIALEIALSRWKGKRVYGFADTLGSFSAGLGEIVLGLFLGPVLLGLYDFAYGELALVRWPEGSIVPWILAFALGDLGYYWYHRAGHSVAALWAIHGVHHQSEHFNVSVATRHPWFSDTYAFLFYAPIPMLGVPPLHFFVAISIISFYALTVHSRVFHRPGLWFLVTPATHIVHHSKNRRYLNKNFGAMFTVWDRMFGTHVEVDPADPPVLGTPFGYQTHDGARAQWVFFRDLFAVARQAKTFGDKVRTFVRHPGWTPEGIVFPRQPPARPDAAIPTRTKIYAALAFAATLAFALYLLWLRDRHPFWQLAAGALVVLWGLSTIGGLLDGRDGAAKREGVRVAATAALGLAIALSSSAS
ncbi:sterol desaturase family protein [Polyangium sp. 6x1]|uniref:sterol desaturase family protein n=1 Tax=Polyangium sp. 6x1 TaxID=3042689 RepID=UPI002482A856|nr:sterol desaturase family protein [Polyangium sp. 6x1]MDI1449983.1 sterol desaturase family protein [Polyangium sp. 6x1]